MKILRPTIIGIVGLLALLNNNVYGAFDENGNYYCDSSNIGLEEEICKAAVNTLNFQLQEVLGVES